MNRWELYLAKSWQSVMDPDLDDGMSSVTEQAY